MEINSSPKGKKFKLDIFSHMKTDISYIEDLSEIVWHQNTSRKEGCCLILSYRKTSRISYALKHKKHSKKNHT